MSKEELQQAAQVIDSHFRKRLQATGEPLQAVSNVIELKPDKRYLLVFKGHHANEAGISQVLEYLRANGINGIGIGLSNGQELEVIEAPATQEGDVLD